ncbi:phage terminase small subunit P27 family [Escherichia coli]|uniref:phage terminase small subunit P27 family n=1 Tax=Escherichia coli TaxID=562 RepID=UPI002FCCFA9D
MSENLLRPEEGESRSRPPVRSWQAIRQAGINKFEPKFTPITHADPPEWFDETARHMWDTIIRELCAQRVLYVTDLHNVVAFCTAFRNWHESQQEVMRVGITVESEAGPKKNPALTAANEAARQMVTFGSLLGLDPASRQRL